MPAKVVKLRMKSAPPKARTGGLWLVLGVVITYLALLVLGTLVAVSMAARI